MSKAWLKAAGIRALKTVAETAGSMIVIGMSAFDIDWIYVLSCSLVAGIASLLLSIKGLPEVSTESE